LVAALPNSGRGRHLAFVVDSAPDPELAAAIIKGQNTDKPARGFFATRPEWRHLLAHSSADRRWTLFHVRSRARA
jgi:hypothetical protein